MKPETPSATTNKKVVRTYHPDGSLASEDSYSNKGKTLDGISRKWHSNGQIESEISMIDGSITGRMRVWADDGVLIVNKFYLSGTPISKRKYDLLCERDSSLPRFPNERVSNTLASFVRNERRRRLSKADAGLDEEKMASLRMFDQECSDIVKSKETRELISLLRANARREIMFGDLDRRQAMAFAKRLYALGAKRVYAIEIETDPDGATYANKLIISLPKDSESKKRIFECSVAKARSVYGAPVIGVGEKFYRVSLF